jgi:hypothetical protein
MKTPLTRFRHPSFHQNDNIPRTLSSAGTPLEYQTPSSGGAAAAAAPRLDDVDESWFKNMWLSNGDFVRYCDAAIRLPLAAGEMKLVNAMSRNSGMRWSLDETVRVLGVEARDDVAGHSVVAG